MLNNTKKETSEVVVQSTIERPTSYVVVRDGFRVSDKEYASMNDSVAIGERDFWKRVSDKYSCEPVKIVQYDSKKHRVW